MRAQAPSVRPCQPYGVLASSRRGREFYPPRRAADPGPRRLLGPEPLSAVSHDVIGPPGPADLRAPGEQRNVLEALKVGLWTTSTRTPARSARRGPAPAP